MRKRIEVFVRARVKRDVKGDEMYSVFDLFPHNVLLVVSDDVTTQNK